MSDLPLYFVEAQLQKDPDLCSRMLTEIMLYWRHHPPRGYWRAVILVPTRKQAPKLEEAYETFAPVLSIISIKELSESENTGIELLRLITTTQRKAPEQARKLVKLTQQEIENPAQQAVQDFISTIMVYKFPNLSHQELEVMLELESIKKTRVYQEAREEGKLEAVPALHLRNFSIQEIAEILGLTVEKVQSVLPKP
jgi:predicted transposase/invertase (TIGR01784 family)